MPAMNGRQMVYQPDALQAHRLMAVPQDYPNKSNSQINNQEFSIEHQTPQFVQLPHQPSLQSNDPTVLMSVMQESSINDSRMQDYTVSQQQEYQQSIKDYFGQI